EPPNVAALVQRGGVMIMSLRYGPIPPGRRLFAVPADATVHLATSEGLRLTLQREGQDSIVGRPAAILVLVGRYGLSTSWPDLFRPSPQHGAVMDGRNKSGHDDVATRWAKLRIAAPTACTSQPLCRPQQRPHRGFASGQLIRLHACRRVM